MAWAQSNRPASHRVRLVLLLLALAAASVAQGISTTLPWVSLCGFALAVALVAICGRDKLAPRTREPNPETPLLPPELWFVFGTGVLLCGGAGAAVVWRADPVVSHALWGGGLLCLALAALRANGGRERRPRPWGEVAALALLIVGCAFLFGWRLTALPADVHGDDAEVGLDALRLLHTTPFNLFGTGWFRLPIFHAVPTAIGLELFGHDLLGLRATSAIIGTVTVVLTFALARRLWNFEVAIISAIVLATGRYFLHLSRAGYHYIDTPCVSVAVLLCFLVAWRERRLGAAIWGGIVLGLGMQTYYASRLVAPLLVLTWVLWLWRSDTKRRPARVVALLVMGISTAATAAPMIAYFSDHWIDLWRRSIDTSVFAPAAQTHLAEAYPGMSLARIVLRQLRDSLLLYNVTPDTSLQYGDPRALLDRTSAVFFVLGFAGVCTAVATRRAQLLLLWIVIPVILGGALTIDAPFFPRVSGTLPFVAITIALGLTRLLHALRAVLRGRPEHAGGGAGGRAGHAPLATALTALITLAVLSTAAVDNLRRYFIEYAPRNRYGPGIDIARWIQATGAGRTTYLIGGAPQFSIRHGTIRFLNQGSALRDIENLEETLAAETLDPETSRFVIMPRAIGSRSRLEAALGPLRVEPHWNEQTIAFYTAVPQQQSDAPATTDPVTVGSRGAGPPARRHTHGRLTDAAPTWVVIAFVAASIASVVLLAWLVPRTFVTAPWGYRAARRAPPPSRFWSALGDPGVDTRPRPPRSLICALLGVIMLAGAGLRLYQLAQLPAGFYCDEAGLGYNAWSIAQSGRDETGARWPLFVWSFDTSYKNPVWLYSAILPISVLGLNEMAVRLTSALYGSATILASFFLGRALFGPWGGLLAAGIIAVVPWHLHFSRIGFELITFPFFFVWGVTCLVRSVQGRRLLPLAALLFGYSLYTYAIAKLFVPIFLAGAMVVLRRQLKPRWREVALAGGVLALTSLPLILFDLQNRERAGHYFADTSVFAVPQAPLALATRIVRQYASFFSPTFLFWRGDRVVRHAVQDHGELYLLFAPFLLVGLIVAWRRRDPLQRLLLWWLAVYPLAPSLMTEAPTASRGIIGLPAFCLLIALGAETSWRILPRVIARRDVARALQLLLLGGGILFTAAHLRHYWRLYSEEYPLYAAKYYTGFQYGHREVIDYFRRHQDAYDLMLLTAHRSNQAHIFPLFYTRFPPRLFQQDPEGALRRTVKMQVGWLKELERFEQYDRLLFAVTDDELDDITDYEERARIIAPDGTPAFVLIDIFPGRSFIRSWIVGGPYPSDDDSPPPVADPGDALPEARPGSGWRVVHAEEAEVDLDDLFTPDADEACAWAVNAVYSPVGRTVRVRAGFDDAGQVWINGTRLELEVQRRPDAPLLDPHVGEGQLEAGRNVVAVRSCEVWGDWYFYLNLTEPNGQPVQGLEWERRQDNGVGDR